MSRLFQSLLYICVFVTGALVSLPSWAAFQAPPQPEGPVYDGADVLSADQEHQLVQKLSSFRKSNGPSVVVALIPSLEGEDLKDVSYEIASGWGIGKEKNNDGVLLLISVAEARAAGPGATKCGCVRIEVGEYLEGALTDARSLKILKGILPAVVSGDFVKATNEGTSSIFEALGGQGVSTDSSNSSEEDNQELPWWAWVLIVIVIVLLASKGIVIIPFGNGGFGGGSGGSSFGGGGFGGGGADL